MVFLNKLKIGKDYFFTFLTEFMILVAGIVIYKLAALNFGNQGFSEYALCRRTISFIHPMLLLGFAVGIPRYIAMHSHDGEKGIADNYFICGTVISVSFSVLMLAVINAFSLPVSKLLFGSENMERFIFPISILILGLIIHSVCYSYFRGKLMMKKANFMQFVNLGIIPLVIYFYDDVMLALTVTGTACLAVSMFFLMVIFTGIRISFTDFRSHSRELFFYGIQRIPGDLALAGFFALPAFIVSHQSGIIIAGYIAFSISLLNMVGAAFGPFSLIMLPRSVQLIKSNDMAALRKSTHTILKITLLTTLAALLIFETFSREIIFLYLGENFEELVVCARIVMLATVGYSVYICLRSVLDAAHYKAVNTKNMILSFGVFILLSAAVYFTKSGYHMLLYAFVFSISLLGFITFYECRKIFKKVLQT